MRPLDRKLLRDLWSIKGQAVAISLVIGAGVAMLVMYLSNFDSLRLTQTAFYERSRFADVFAGLKRAPDRLAERIAEIPGVAAVETRVVADVTLDVPGLDEPAVGRLISIPAGRPSVLNDLFLRRGRALEPGRPDEVLVGESFALAHHLGPGSTVGAVINGRRRTLAIVGVALSPEYVYSIRPGEVVPDDRLFGVFWMEQRALATAFDMQGGFNDVALKLMPGASAAEAITPPGPPAGHLRRPRRHSAVAADLALVPGERAELAADGGVDRAGDLPGGGGVSAQRRPHPHRRRPARADRGAQGARLQPLGDRHSTT